MIDLRQAGEDVTSPTSPIFPAIPLTQIIPTVGARAWQVGTSQALEEFEHLIRNEAASDRP